MKIHRELPTKRSVANFIVNHRRAFEVIFGIVIFLSLLCSPYVEINYDLKEYLPAETPSETGINRMEEEFGYPGTARVMVDDVSLYEAKVYKDKIEAVDGVDRVTWADSKTDIYQAEEFIKSEDIKDYYKDGHSVMDIVFEESDTSERTSRAIDEIREITGAKSHLVGPAVQDKSTSEGLGSEMKGILVLAFILIALVLCLSTTSWFEPVLFLLIMGITIIINNGTNIFLGRISFLTSNVSSILVLACSTDFAIFLLHAFIRQKEAGKEPDQAIRSALEEAFNSIIPSGVSTVAGFMMLTLMKFTIGFDLGIVLAKGIVFSMATVLFLMPAFILHSYKLVEKTSHRPFLPKFEALGKFSYKIRYAVLVLAALIAVPAYVTQDMNDFVYGNETMGASPGTQLYEDQQAIDAQFGRSNMLMILYPNTSMIKEKQLSEELENLSYMKSVTSLSNTLPEGVPTSFVPKSMSDDLHTDRYARILLYIKTRNESELSFRASDEIQAIVKKYYPKDFHVIGETPSTQDIKTTINGDYDLVNLLSLLGVGLIYAITFKSALVPILLLIPVEMSMMLDMVFPYLMGSSTAFLGYLIVSNLLLGATDDYGILIAGTYLERRGRMERKQAYIETIATCTPSVLASGTILAGAGYILHFFSSLMAIGDLGHLVGRGALLSMVIVLFLLPAILYLFDKPILRGQQKRLNRLQRLHELKNRYLIKASIMRPSLHIRRIIIMKNITRIFSGILAAAVLVSVLPTTVRAAGPAVTTDETVYVNLDYYGKTENISVVKGVRLNDNTSFTDYGSYDKVTNMSSEDKPDISDDFVSWNLSDRISRFYYECIPKSGTIKIPWTFDISYKLNGVPADAKKLAGASGQVEINVKAKPNEKVSDYIKNNMTLAVSATFDMEDTLSVEAPGGQLQTMGNKKTVMFAGLPGEENDYTIRIGTDSFETTGIIMAMVPGTLDQVNEMKEFKESKDTIEDSANAIYDSLNEVLNTYQSASNGLAQVQAGLSELDDARGTIDASKNEIYEEADLTLKDITSVNKQLNALVPHLKNGQQLVQEVNTDTNAITDTLNSFSPYLNSFMDSVGSIQSDTEEMSDIIDNVNAVSADRDTLLDNITSNLNTADSDLDKIKSVTDDMGEDIDSLRDDLEELHDLAADLEELEGVKSMKELRAVLSGLDYETLQYLITTYNLQELAVLLERLSGKSLSQDTIDELDNDINKDLKYLSEIIDAVDDVYDSTDDILSSTEKMFKVMNGISENSDEFISNAHDTVDLARAYSESMDAGLVTTQNLLGELNAVGDTSKSLLDTGNVLIFQISDFNDTMNSYEKDMVDSLKNMEKLMYATTKGLTDMQTLFSAFETMMKASDNSINNGTAKTLSGSIDLLQKGLDSMTSVSTIKNANDTIKRTYDKEMDDLEKDSNVLNMDPEAAPVSFTSSQNSAPSSIQVIMRTQEISIDDEEESNKDLEKTKENPGLFSRLAKIFTEIGHKIISLFSA